MKPKDLQGIFTEIYNNNAWASDESRSGGGSEMARTAEIRTILPQFIEEFDIKRMLDAGCGDTNWLPDLRCQYEGCEIVPDLVKYNQAKYAKHNNSSKFKFTFFQADLVRDAFHAYDLIVCRTVLFHLSLANISLALENFRRSGSSFLMATTHPAVEINRDIDDGNWRRVNLMKAPFNLPKPIELWVDGPGSDGYIGVWNLRHG